MFRKTHEAEIAEYAADLKRANEARDNWRDSSKEWEAKFKTAATDLAKQAEEIEGLKAILIKRTEQLDRSEAIIEEQEGEIVNLRELAEGRLEIIDRMTADVLSLRPDAQKWRNARDKRAKNRGGGK